MKCPHCGQGIHQSFEPVGTWLDDYGGGKWRVQSMRCPLCQKRIMVLESSFGIGGYIFLPKDVLRILSSDVPDPYASDFQEAAGALGISPKASAALSRRCLQALLREKGKVKHGDLTKEIDEAMQSLPSHLADSIDAIRNIGNFAAHPNKSTNTAEVIDVEPGEAEWCLDVLEDLFDFYLVQPAVTARKRAALDAKLQDANKPPMK